MKYKLIALYPNEIRLKVNAAWPPVTAYSQYSFDQADGDPCEMDRNGYDADYPADTLAEARRRARHMLTDEYRHLIESEQPMAYVQIRRGDDVVADFFR